MKENDIVIALMVKPGKKPCSVPLLKNRQFLNRAVSLGAAYEYNAEAIRLCDHICILKSEEGSLDGAKGNRMVNGRIIAGVFYVVGVDEDNTLTSLSPKQLQHYKKCFNMPEYYTDQEVWEDFWDQYYEIVTEM